MPDREMTDFALQDVLNESLMCKAEEYYKIWLRTRQLSDLQMATDFFLRAREVMR